MPPRFWDAKDTIVAQATAPAGGIRGVVRMSGPDSLSILARLIETHAPATAAQLKAAKAAQAIDAEIPVAALHSHVEAQLLLWPDQRSYTRQPSVEIHTYGSPPILNALLDELCRAGARLAEPGEFTLRAFLAGRLDLTQAEAVLGVIDAEDKTHLDQALEQLAGGMATPLHEMRDELLDLLAHLEAGLDFADEDIEFITSAQLQSDILQIAGKLRSVTEQFASRVDHTDLPRVVLCGPPNAGKSSLFNALLGRSAAIVSPKSGATRDYVSSTLTLSPTMRCLLLDTAGEDLSVANADQLAQQTSQRERRRAAIKLLCLDGLEEETTDQFEADDATIVLATKCDAEGFRRCHPKAIPVSANSGAGLEKLRSLIAGRLRSTAGSGALATAARCGSSLELAAEALDRANATASDNLGEELVAAELRLALDELGRVVGAIYNDDILDRVFSRFCIGK